MPETVAIIGAGPLGRWLALSAARAGFRVLLEDVMPANLHHAQEYLRQQLGPSGPGSIGHGLAGQGLVSQGFNPGADRSGFPVKDTGFSPYIEPAKSTGSLQAAENLGVLKGHDFSRAVSGTKRTRALAPEGSLSDHSPVSFVSTIEDAVRNADLAIDCVPDELESKLEILWLLDRMAPPRTVLATPTTRLSIADLAACTYRPDKCIAIAAEASSLSAGSSKEILLRTTAKTSPATVALVENFWRKLGFTPTFTPDPSVP